MKGDLTEVIDRKCPIHSGRTAAYAGRGEVPKFVLLFCLFLGGISEVCADTFAPLDARDTTTSLLWSTLHPLSDPLRSAPAELQAPLRRPEAVSRGGLHWVCDDRRGSAGHAANDDIGRIAGVVKPDSAVGEPMTLMRVIDYALCRNAKVRASWSEIRLRASELGQARAAYLPTLNLGISQLDNRTTDTRIGVGAQDVSTRASLNLAWRIFDFGKRSAQHEAASWRVTAALSGQNAVVLDALIDVVQGYYDVQTTRAVLQVREHMYGLGEQTVASALRRHLEGANAQSEVLQARAALARSDLDRSRAEGEWLQAHAQLVYLLGWRSGAALRLAEEVSDGFEDSETLVGDKGAAAMGRVLDDWLEGARQHHPGIAAAQAQWQAAVFHAKATAAEGLPNVDFNVGVFNNGRPTQGIRPRGSREQVVGLTLNLPLFDGFSHSYRVAGAKAEAETKRLQYEDAEQSVTFELVKMHARAQAAWRNFQAAAELQRAALQNSRSLQRQFDQGAVNVIDVTRAHRALAEAQLERIKAWAQWETAKMELALVPGMGHGGGVGYVAPK